MNMLKTTKLVLSSTVAVGAVVAGVGATACSGALATDKGERVASTAAAVTIDPTTTTRDVAEPQSVATTPARAPRSCPGGTVLDTCGSEGGPAMEIWDKTVDPAVRLDLPGGTGSPVDGAGKTFQACGRNGGWYMVCEKGDDPCALVLPSPGNPLGSGQTCPASGNAAVAGVETCTTFTIAAGETCKVMEGSPPTGANCGGS